MNSRSKDEKGELLPGTITSINPQKKRKNRYSIFVDEIFLIGISESVLLSHQIQKGMQLSQEKFREIKSAENQQYARNYFLNLLSRRQHTRRELKRKASQKDIDPQTIEILLDEFEEKNWIDHSSYTDRFIQDKFQMNRWGPRKIISALQQKGIDRHEAKSKTDQYFESVDLLDIFIKLVNKKAYKFKQIEDRFKLRKKVFDYLARKGYHSSQILSHMDRLIEDL